MVNVANIKFCVCSNVILCYFKIRCEGPIVETQNFESQIIIHTTFQMFYL